MIWLLATLLPAVAQDDAPGFNARGVLPAAPSTDLRDPVFAWRAKGQRAGAFGLHLLGEYADEPLVLYTNEGGEPRVDPRLDNLFVAHLMGGVAVHERVAIHAGLPVVLSHQVDGSAAGLNLGDARLSVPIGLLLPDEGSGAAVSVIPHVDLPTGAAKNYLGYDLDEGFFSGGAALAGGYTGGIWGLDGYVGVGTSPRLELENLRGGVAGTGGLAGHVLLGNHHAVRLEANGQTGTGDTSKRWSQSPAEAALSVRGKYVSGLTWTVGGAQGLSRGAGAAAFRVFLGIGYAPGTKPAPTAVVEAPDPAPPRPEPVLPSNLVVTVVDGDGNPLDARLTFAGADPVDPVQAGADGSEDVVVTAGSWRILAEAEGFGTGRQEVTVSPGERREVRITLNKPKVTVTQDEIQLEKVLFHFDETRLIDASKPILEECANVLLTHPEITLVEIAGHTDLRGTDAYNLDLSQGRVDTVRRYLISKGVQAERLRAKGYGESNPLVRGESEADHQLNRRVEFRILERTPAEASP